MTPSPTYVRDDTVISKSEQDEHINLSHGLINIKHQGKELWIMNVYIRDKELKVETLQHIDKKYKNILIMGDTNVMHQDLLLHTQLTHHNENGGILKNFLEGAFAG